MDADLGVPSEECDQDKDVVEPRKNEAEVDAKIAQIRARNEALMKRRAEVEADRKLAEERLAAVSVKMQVTFILIIFLNIANSF